MLVWILNNAATIVLSAVLAAVVYFIARGIVRGRIKTCDCGSSSDCSSGCAACPFGGSCSKNGREEL